MTKRAQNRITSRQNARVTAELLRRALSECGQDAIAPRLIELIEADARQWESAFACCVEKLTKLADESLAELRFRRTFAALPDSVKALAKSAYKQFQHDRNHPSLDFKRVKGAKQPVYSARIGLGYCAIGIMMKGGDVLWCWIGSHSDYDKLIL